MKCTVYLYDDSSPKQLPVTQLHIIIQMTSTVGVSLASKKNKRFGPEYGAVLNPGVAAEPYQIYVDDPGGSTSSPVYAPASLGDLNGSVTGRIDVTLYPLPVGTGGDDDDDWGTGNSRLATTQTEIREHITRRVDANDWTPSEARGVRSLVSTTQRAVQAPEWDSKLDAMRMRWISTCASLGIHVAGGSSGMRPARA